MIIRILIWMVFGVMGAALLHYFFPDLWLIVALGAAVGILAFIGAVLFTISQEEWLETHRQNEVNGGKLYSIQTCLQQILTEMGRYKLDLIKMPTTTECSPAASVESVTRSTTSSCRHGQLGHCYDCEAEHYKNGCPHGSKGYCYDCEISRVKALDTNRND